MTAEQEQPPSSFPSMIKSPQRAGIYPWMVTLILAMAFAVAFIDRQVLNLLVEPVKNSLAFSDTEFSLLQGLGFVAAYASMGVVFGRLTDQHNRRNLLVLGIVIWCFFTVACGFATGFWSFFAARAGIGAAEACLTPAGWSMLADYFSRERLPRAVSLFLIGPFIGGGLALIFGGLLLQELAASTPVGIFAGIEAWRLTFFAVGAPGTLIALLVWLAVREPRRYGDAALPVRSYSLREGIRYLLEDRVYYGSFFGGVALLVVGVYALPAWTPALLIRAYGADVAIVGLQYGTATLIAGTLGVLLGPWVASLLRRRYPADAPFRTAMTAAFCAAPACIFLPFAPSYWSALLASAFASCCLNFTLPVAAATLQTSSPNRLRGLVTSIYAFVLTVTGLGVAPTLIALGTDRVLRNTALVGISLGWITGLSALASLPLLAIAARRYSERLPVA